MSDHEVMYREWGVKQPEDWSIYELLVQHRMDGLAVEGDGEFFVHPDECNLCKDSDTHAAVQEEMRKIEAAYKEIKPFFSESTPAELILNIGMSFHLVLEGAERVDVNA